MSSMHKTQQLMPNGVVSLDGDRRDIVFVAVHGWGSSVLDLLPLAEALHDQGFSVHSTVLPGHWPDLSQSAPAYTDLLARVRSTVQAARSDESRVFVVGFSTGATVGLELLLDGVADGCVAISPFLGPRFARTASLILRTGRQLRRETVPRWLQISRRARTQIEAWSALPVDSTLQLISRAEEVRERLASEHSRNRVLALHSHGDRVVSIDPVLELARDAPDRWSLLTTPSSPHYMQFDLDPALLADLVVSWAEEPNDSIEARDALAEVRDSQHREYLQWTENLFRLIVGFYALFAAAVGFTIDDALDGASATATRLGYVLLISLYLAPALVYSFYIARNDAFRRTFLESGLFSARTDSVPLVAFRTSTKAAGRLSGWLTFLAATVVTFVPVVAALWITIDTLDPPSVLDGDGIQVALAAAGVATCVLALGMVGLLRFTRREVYERPPFRGDALTTVRAIRLLAAIEPGCVTQSRRARDAVRELAGAALGTNESDPTA